MSAANKLVYMVNQISWVDRDAAKVPHRSSLLAICAVLVFVTAARPATANGSGSGPTSGPISPNPPMPIHWPQSNSPSKFPKSYKLEKQIFPYSTVYPTLKPSPTHKSEPSPLETDSATIEEEAAEISSDSGKFVLKNWRYIFSVGIPMIAYSECSKHWKACESVFENALIQGIGRKEANKLSGSIKSMLGEVQPSLTDNSK